jgi:hypothetical protein
MMRRKLQYTTAITACLALAGCSSTGTRRITQGNTAPILQELGQPAGWEGYKQQGTASSRSGVAMPEETALPVRTKAGADFPPPRATSVSLPEPAETASSAASAGEDIAMPVRKGI